MFGDGIRPTTGLRLAGRASVRVSLRVRAAAAPATWPDFALGGLRERLSVSAGQPRRGSSPANHRGAAAANRLGHGRRTTAAPRLSLPTWLPRDDPEPEGRLIPQRDHPLLVRHEPLVESRLEAGVGGRPR